MVNEGPSNNVYNLRALISHERVNGWTVDMPALRHDGFQYTHLLGSGSILLHLSHDQTHTHSAQKIWH